MLYRSPRSPVDRDRRDNESNAEIRPRSDRALSHGLLYTLSHSHQLLEPRRQQLCGRRKSFVLDQRRQGSVYSLGWRRGAVVSGIRHERS